MVRNEGNIRSARLGTIGKGNHKYTFTHRNPKTGDFYAEDFLVMDKDGKFLWYGAWIKSERVTFA